MARLALPLHIKRLLLFALFLAPGLLNPRESFAAWKTRTLQKDGAWCWFQDERSLLLGDDLIAGSISSQGDVQVASWNMRTDEARITVLHPALERDDHDSPSLLARSDGRILAYYTRHGSDDKMRSRLSTLSGSIESFLPETTYSAGLGKGFTYSNPFQIANEAGRIFNFWRGAFWNPTVAYSDDQGETWSRGYRFIRIEGHRPYVKYAASKGGRIHFAFTEAHPLEFSKKLNRGTRIYHAYLERGVLHRSDGARVGSLESGISVFDATAVTPPDDTQSAWVWDLEIDSQGNPVIAYSVAIQRMDPSTDHRYRVARWDGSAWRITEVARAGRALYADEPFYSGGIALDPLDPASVAYFAGNAASTRYRIERATRGSTEAAWKSEVLFSHPSQDLLRPIVPRGAHGRPQNRGVVLWMQGQYRSYVDYATDVMAAIQD